MTDDLSSYLDSVTVADLDRDPYPVYARLRREAPVAHIPAVDTWFVTAYDDVAFVAEHPDLFPAEHGQSPVEITFGTPTLITVDGPVHHDLRRSFDPNFRPRRVLQYIHDLVRPLAEEYAAGLVVGSEAELMSEYFEPISVRSLAVVLGLGDVDVDTLRRWFHGMNLGATNFEHDPVKQAEADAVCAEIDAVVVPRMERLRDKPDNSTMSHLLHAGAPAGRPREIDHVLPSLKVAILGGMQEPGHAGGTVMCGLFAEPDQLELVRGDPAAWVPSAVEEGLRWVAPIGTQFRTAAADVELGGTTIPSGSGVSAVLASANRDESKFDDADRYDLHRVNRHQAAFGFGKHFCSGHSFARLQMQIAVEVLFVRHPSVRSHPEHPASFRGWEFRAPGALPVLL
ncbi:MAG TPA: cytochrome P450 [Actinomycetes bacterium]|nr:cytochrome P450 [Actinomycetes bacterium]